MSNLLFFILNFPITIKLLLEPEDSSFSYFLLVDLYYTSYTINFFIYLITNSNFRRAFFHVFGFRSRKKIVGLSKKEKSFVFRVPIFLFRFRFIFHFRFSNGMNLFKEMVSDCLSKSVFSSFDLALKTPKQNSGRRRNVADFFEKPFPLHETCYRDCERFFFLHQTSFSVR